METLSFAILFMCAIHLSFAKNFLYPGESLYTNESLVSESSEFKFGFFTAGGPSNYYIGIWLAYSASQVQPPVLDDSSGVVWVGNRESPVLKSLPSEFSLSQNGDLILTQSQELVWSSNATQTESVSDTVLVLLDNGNLVLHDRMNSSKVIWQSFYHPTNTWFPGAGLGFTNIDGENKGLGYLLFLKRENNNDQLSIYSYAHLKHATRHFSIKIGEGGFGSVFKGRLLNGTEIAVKKLKIVEQEEKQFRGELQTIGMIRHANLTRLLGFCTEGGRRILVYEYMSNGSLDSHLFRENSSTLSWQERYKIVIGIARGLTYLHEECRDCIIHCDIKPENVLLGETFFPKISDFGMAKLLGRDFSRALTTIRGTFGYLAPEWFSGEAITEKADVYSFGMMLFEIISGKRNANKFNNTRYPYFPLYAMVKMNEGEVLCFLDDKLRGNVNVVELIRACKVAGWCIQEPEMRRPSMRKVVLMLEGVISVGIPPVPKSLLNLVDADDY
ncbi:hypothetical protein LUZ61_013949 [Rhynchospora tenuis]|uniref:non-specific serine/threonine protein kinase n=1 Tax=Rhynchospora tenuis TaxID=198213 RepID=A0AAD5Z0P6_9POAL|nr:hypothetical protein LUZ61_013949 [Rhynchospora tenuis]